MSDSDEHLKKLLMKYFPQFVDSIKETKDLIPLIEDDIVVEQMMLYLLYGQPSTLLLLDMDLGAVMRAYDIVLSGGFWSSEQTDRALELQFYVSATLHLDPSEEEQIVAANLLKEIIEKNREELTPVLVQQVNDSVNGEGGDLHAVQSDHGSNKMNNVGDNSSEHVHDDNSLTKEVHLGDEDYPDDESSLSESGGHAEVESDDSEEDRADLYEHYRLCTGSLPSDEEFNSLRVEYRHIGGYKEANPAFVLCLMKYSARTLLQILRSICRGHKDYYSNDREQAHKCFHLLSNETLDYIYALYKCASHQGDSFKRPTRDCWLCKAKHFPGHCMRNLTLELHLQKMIDLSICSQCGKEDCGCFNNHPLIWACTSCRNCIDPKDANHHKDYCNNPVRWIPAKHSNNGESDLFVYATDMAMIARATLNWTDTEWRFLFHSLRTFILANWRENRNTANLYYNIQTEADRKRMKGQGFVPQKFMPEKGDAKWPKAPLPIVRSKRNAMAPVPQKVVAKPLLSQRRNMPRRNDFPDFVWSRRLPTSGANLIAVGARTLILSDTFSNFFLPNRETTDDLLRACHLLVQSFDNVRKNIISPGDLYTSLVSFEEVCKRMLFKETALTSIDVMDFLRTLFLRLSKLSFQDGKNLHALCLNATAKEYSCTKCSFEEDSELTRFSNFRIDLSKEGNNPHLSDILHRAFLSYVDGVCSSCKEPRKAAVILQSVADVCIVHVERISLSGNGGEICRSPLIIDPQLVLKIYSGEDVHLSLEIVVCADMDQVNDWQLDVSRTFFMYGGSWYNYEDDSVAKVSTTIVKNHVSMHGFIFIFRKKEGV